MLTSIALALFLSNPAVAADQKFAVVDMQKAIQTSDAGKKARKELEDAFNKKKKELSGEETALKKMQEDFQKQQAALNPAAKAKKQQELQERFMKYQETLQKSQAEIQKREQEMSAPIIEKIKGVISDIAKAKGFDAVLEKNENVILFSKSEMDLTDDVLKVINK